MSNEPDSFLTEANDELVTDEDLMKYLQVRINALVFCLARSGALDRCAYEKIKLRMLAEADQIGASRNDDV